MPHKLSVKEAQLQLPVIALALPGIDLVNEKLKIQTPTGTISPLRELHVAVSSHRVMKTTLCIALVLLGVSIYALFIYMTAHFGGGGQVYGGYFKCSIDTALLSLVFLTRSGLAWRSWKKAEENAEPLVTVLDALCPGGLSDLTLLDSNTSIALQADEAVIEMAKITLTVPAAHSSFCAEDAKALHELLVSVGANGNINWHYGQARARLQTHQAA